MVALAATVQSATQLPPDPSTRLFAGLVAVFSVAAYARRSVAVGTLVVTLVVAAILTIPDLAGDPEFFEIADDFVFLTGAWVVGDNVRSRRERAAALEQRAAALEREREEHTLRAAQEERARIARELHDVVAHHLSVITVQAGAARLVSEERPEEARAALARIEDVSRNALAEMRRLLGVLRSTDDGPDRAPQPGLGGLESLLEPVRRAGIRVVTEVSGEPRPLPAELDLTAFRIVQEAVTNTLRHADATALRVVVRYAEEDLEIEVIDHGSRPKRDPGGIGNGKGIRGMRERVGLFGGSVEVEVEPDGFAVRARLPIPGTGADRQ